MSTWTINLFICNKVKICTQTPIFFWTSKNRLY